VVVRFFAPRFLLGVAGLTILVLTSVATALAGPRQPSYTAAARPPLPAASGADDFRPRVRFTTPHSSVAAEPTTATLDVPGPGGAFAVPYIQASPDLDFALELNGPPGRTTVDVVLDLGRPEQQSLRLHGPSWAGTFHGLGFGEHTLDARMYAGEEGLPDAFVVAQPPVALARLEHIARGDVVAALGDSTTEGLGGGPYAPGEIDHLTYFADWLEARTALRPIDLTLVSDDGRQYPQAGASLHPASRPSFVVPLARLLEARTGHPVLVINEGWSGITSDGFVKVAQSQHFHDLVAAAHPNLWLVNLGANDAAVQRPALEYQQRLEALVAGIESLGAAPGDIRLACPSYRSGPLSALEATYLPVVDFVRGDKRLGPAPDFFRHYRDQPDQLGDSVHPNAAGYAAMAQMWSGALGGSGSRCAG
jgi:lysophospholipase L1-like esterase